CGMPSIPAGPSGGRCTPLQLGGSSHTESPSKTTPGNARIPEGSFRLACIRKVCTLRIASTDRKFPMRVALYLRVNTSAQTVENQERELAAVAAAGGGQVVETYRDEGISGAKGRDRRPGFDRLWKDAA